MGRETEQNRMPEGFACMVSVAFVVAALIGAVCYLMFK